MSGVVLLYSGRGAYAGSLEPTRKRLKEELDPGYYQVEEFDRSNFVSQLSSKNVSLIVIPGGSTAQIEGSLFTDGEMIHHGPNHIFEEFQKYMSKDSARYLGLGAGGMLVTSHYELLDFNSSQTLALYTNVVSPNLFKGKAIFCQRDTNPDNPLNAAAVPVMQEEVSKNYRTANSNSSINITMTSSNSRGGTTTINTRISGNTQIKNFIVSSNTINISKTGEAVDSLGNRLGNLSFDSASSSSAATSSTQVTKPFNTFFKNGICYVGDNDENYTSLHHFTHLPQFTTSTGKVITKPSSAILCFNNKAVLTGNNVEIQAEDVDRTLPAGSGDGEEITTHMNKVKESLILYKDDQQKAFRSYLQALGIKTIIS